MPVLGGLSQKKVSLTEDEQFLNLNNSMTAVMHTNQKIKEEHEAVETVKRILELSENLRTQCGILNSLEESKFAEKVSDRVLYFIDCMGAALVDTSKAYGHNKLAEEIRKVIPTSFDEVI